MPQCLGENFFAACGVSRPPKTGMGLTLALLLMLLTGFLGGCSGPSSAADPWEQGNRFFYTFDDVLDKVTFKPLSEAYVKFVPPPIRTGLGNAFDNLGYGDVILNDFLQGKWNQGWSDSGRMAVNTTVGIAGIFDVAGHWGMEPHDNDFGITLGKWGMQLRALSIPAAVWAFDHTRCAVDTGGVRDRSGPRG